MEKSLGIYIHIPFCASKCAYCNFYSLAGCEHLIPKYHEAILRHIKESAPQLGGYLTDTVYFGGGTPSYFGADRIIEIFEALKKYGNVLMDSEVTVEANPDSISYSDMVLMRKAGINRLSIGVQSANDGILKSLGRRHTFAEAEKTVADAKKAGFDNISIDLIFGLPSQSKEDWADTLSRAIALKPSHFSCYGLKIEKNTPLYMFKDSPFIPDDDAQADMYLFAVDTLSRAGYYQYEISNFAQKDKQSRHNLKYWQAHEYMGFGAAAHSYIGSQRYSYISNIEKYTANILSGDSVVEQNEYISRYECSMEYLMLGLRTTHGISEEEYRAIYPCSFDLTNELLKLYQKQGWALENEGRWFFTPKGFLVSNTLISNILEAQTRQRVSSANPSASADEYFPDSSQISIFDKKNEETSLLNGIVF